VTVRVDAEAPEPGVVVEISLDPTGSGQLDALRDTDVLDRTGARARTLAG